MPSAARDPVALTTARAAAAIRRGELSCAQLVAAHVAHMRRANPAVNAVTVDLGDAAIAQAERADRELPALRAAGHTPGPLYGVPVTIKENIDVAGQPTPNGLVALRELVAPDDSPVVRNLKDAGAIVIGRTNTPEFSMRAFTDNPLRGATLNPWNPAITCGGSSGGAGAAAALGIACINHGNDIGGSLRYPAYCNGVSTIRPTLGRLPNFNPTAPAERPIAQQLMAVQGPIARTVADVRLALAVMARHDARDPWWVPAPLEQPSPDAPIRVVVPNAIDAQDVHPAVRDALRTAADALAGAGYAVLRADAPDIERAFTVFMALLSNEMRVAQDPGMRSLASPVFQQVLDGYYAMAPTLDLAGYMTLLAERSTHLRAWLQFFDAYPLVLMPVSLDPPYPVDEDLKGNARLAEVFRRFCWMSGMNLLGLPAAVAPTGLHEGVPIGVQIVASRYREDLCLDAAQAIEDRVGVLSRALDVPRAA